MNTTGLKGQSEASCAHNGLSTTYPAGLCKALSSGIQDQILVEKCFQTQQLDVDVNDFVFQQTGRSLGTVSENIDEEIGPLPSCSCCHTSSVESTVCGASDTESVSDFEIDWEIDLLHGQADEVCLAGDIVNDDADANHAPLLHRTDPGGQGPHLPGDRVQKLDNLVQKIHEQLGHPHFQRFVRTLQFGALPEAIAVAKNLNCSTCARLKLSGPPKRTAMPPPQEF